jgi:hypothetical protein
MFVYNDEIKRLNQDEFDKIVTSYKDKQMGRVYNRVYDRVCFKNLILDDICIFDHLIINCEFNNCLFDNSAFVDCNFRDTTFVNCDFVELKFYGCQFKNYTIKDCSELKIPMHCPETGSFIAYKKALKVKKDFTEEAQDRIIKLFIPETALRSSANTSKCRTNEAIVLEIQNLDGTVDNELDGYEICSCMRHDFVYEVGKHIFINDFDTDRFHECSTGIHFFVDRQEAVDYCI